MEGQEEEKAAAAGAKSTDAKSSTVSFHGCHQRRLLVILVHCCISRNWTMLCQLVVF